LRILCISNDQILSDNGFRLARESMKDRSGGEVIGQQFYRSREDYR
jgi:hypothetical protein